MKMNLVICTLTALIFWGSRHVRAQDLIEMFEEIYSKAQEAYRMKDYARFKEFSYDLLQFSPNHPNLMYQYAKSLALTKNEAKSLEYLKKVINVGGKIVGSAETDNDFTSLFENPYFKDMISNLKQGFQPINNSTIAFTIPTRDLIPEGVAYDPVKETLFISSIYKRKILAIGPQGEIKNFTQEKQDGLLGVIGMEVDPKRRHLWACSAWDRGNDILDIKTETRIYSSVHKYNLETGKLIKKYRSGNLEKSFFNDLTIHSSGDVFITDTGTGEIYTIPYERDTLEIFSEFIKFLYPNGITLSADENDLFVAHYGGIDKINLQTKISKRLLCEENLTLVQVDGLAFYKNSLIAHQGSTLGGVFQYFLDPSCNRVVGKKAIELHNPLFDFPTTGELAGDSYYYIANAQLRRFNQDGSILDFDQLSDVYIFKTILTPTPKME